MLTSFVVKMPWQILTWQIFRQIRTAHWIKHVLIFLPAFFAGQIFHLTRFNWIQLIATFAAFCCLSSAIYCFNDVIDIKEDRMHPAKRLRPLASGYFTRRQTVLIALLVLLAGVSCISVLPKFVAGILCAYTVLNLLYCLWLKQIAIIDVSCISIGFVLRLGAGGLVTGVALSHWIVIITFLLAFSVALSKRRDDLVLGKESNLTFRQAQVGYTTGFIDTAKGISFAVTLVAYILYTVSPEVMERLATEYVYITALPVFLGIMRYLQLSIVKEQTGDPIQLLFRDPFLLTMVVAWLGVFYYFLYG